MPYTKERDDLVRQAEEVSTINSEELGLLEEWNWDDENNGISYNRQVLLANGKPITASTGKCSEQEFVHGAYAASERCAQMGCLYKYLINNKVVKPEKRPFLNFLDDQNNWVPEDVLHPPPW